MTGPPQRPLIQLPVAAAGAEAGEHARQDTVLPEEPSGARRDLAAARSKNSLAALADCCARHPSMLEAWARLGEARLAAGDAVAAYASARVGYHRGLDRLRREGWGGTGMVRWAHAGNRGFLRALHLLLTTAAELDETDESGRCRSFLLELDPADELGIAAYPDPPGRDFTPRALPED